MFSPAYVSVVIIGLLHGLEPAHGWPVALLYSARKRTPILSGLISSSIIASAHFLSSIAVAVAYLFLKRWLNIEAPFLKYVAAALLVILACRMFTEKADEMENQHGHIHRDFPEGEHEHEHEHPRLEKHAHWHDHKIGITLSLWGLASFAFILGFAHEEEFALLALVTTGVNALILMTLYGLSVTMSLIGVTLLSVEIYDYIQPRLMRYEKYVPKIGAAILLAMALIIIFQQ